MNWESIPIINQQGQGSLVIYKKLAQLDIDFISFTFRESPLVFPISLSDFITTKIGIGVVKRHSFNVGSFNEVSALS